MYHIVALRHFWWALSFSASLQLALSDCCGLQRTGGNHWCSASDPSSCAHRCTCYVRQRNDHFFASSHSGGGMGPRFRGLHSEEWALRTIKICIRAID